jgi:glycosyltransferase involved in cell wall biosynthesis
MKVLFTFGGMPHYLIALLNKINDSVKYDVIAVIPEKQGKTIGEGVKQEFKNIKFKLIQTSEYSAYYKKPFLKNLKRIIKTEKPQIIITLWPYVLGFIFYPRLIFAIKRSKIKFIFREIPFNTAPFNNPFKYYKTNPIFNENMVYQKTSGISFYANILFITILRKIFYSFSDATINYTPLAYEIQPSYGIKKENIYITHNSPDTDEIFKVKTELKQLNIQKVNHRIIHIGRLVKWKRVDLLLEAVAKVKAEYLDINLVIVGSGPETESLKKYAEILNITENIEWAGGVYDYPTIGKLLLSSEIYVLAGMGGLSINEAMAFGNPIICSVCDGTEKTLVREGENGTYFESGNSEDLALKIKELFSNPNKLENMGEKSEQIIREEININTVVTNFIIAFDQIIEPV